MLQNKVQLITYPDSLGGSLSDLIIFLDTYLKDKIGGVHVLPFYPSSADRGFSPLTHLEVDQNFGNWEQIEMISSQFDLVVDLTVNHLSAQSAYFKDYLENNNKSTYSKMFLDEESFFERYAVGEESLSDLYRPRPTRPFVTYEFADGTTKEIWTTFTSQQIDLDVESEISRLITQEAITHLYERGVKLIRLDAAGYSVKRPNTNCFLIPETYDYLRWVRSVTPPTVELLAEVHQKPNKQQEILDSLSVEWVYDFSLPFLTLNAIKTANATYLLHWIKNRPSECVSTLDTHDGIGVVDVDELLPQNEIDETIAWIQEKGANHSLRASGTDAEDLDIYQINCTYYSAVGENDEAYILARAIQFFIPGIPQVYYVGLLAGENDYEALALTKHGRDINRHNYTWPEIKSAIEKTVVKRLLKLMQFRSNHPAFGGTFSQQTTDDEKLILHWTTRDDYSKAVIDLKNMTVDIEYTDTDNGEVKHYQP